MKLPFFAKMALQAAKKPIKEWLRDRALKMPRSRMEELATRLGIPIIAVETINQAMINDVLNAIEKEIG